MSVKVMNLVWQDSCLSSPEKMLLLAIADCANDSGYAFPGYKALMAKTSMARATVARHLKTLENAGILVKESHGTIGTGRKVNTYQIRLESLKSLSTELIEESRQNVPISSTLEKFNIETRKVQRSDSISSTLRHEPSINHYVKRQGDDPVDNFPDGLNVEAWNRYIQYRKTMNFRKLKTDGKMKELATFPLDVQAAAIKQTMDNGWQGIFPEKIGGSNGTHRKPDQRQEISRATSDMLRQARTEN